MVASKSHNNQGKKHEKERRQPSWPNRYEWWQVKSHKAEEEQERERRQPSGLTRRKWWQAKATTSREKNMRKGDSPVGQIDANGSKQKPQQAGRKA